VIPLRVGTSVILIVGELVDGEGLGLFEGFFDGFPIVGVLVGLLDIGV
jgi:hypothetical protein